MLIKESLLKKYPALTRRRRAVQSDGSARGIENVFKEQKRAEAELKHRFVNGTAANRVWYSPVSGAGVRGLYARMAVASVPSL